MSAPHGRPVVGGHVIGCPGDAVIAGKVDQIISICVDCGVGHLPFGIVLIESGQPIGIDLFPELTLSVVKHLGGRIWSGRTVIDSLVGPSERVVVGLGPFAGVVAVGVELDFLGEEPVRSVFQFDPLNIAYWMYGRAGKPGQRAVFVIRLDSRAPVGKDVGFDEVAVGIDAFAQGRYAAQGVGLGGYAADHIVGGL